MSSLKMNECSICEKELKQTDDLVTTTCNHTFHRLCAQDHLDTKRKSDCHVCHQESALSEALARLKIISQGECSICEGKWNAQDDLVTTDCNHTFHYECAQNRLEQKNRTDCRTCGKESALGNALTLKNSARKGECSICEEEWNWKDDIITTNCNHTFHRHCAQDRLDEKNKTDCHFCHQPSAFDNILVRNITIDLKKSTKQDLNETTSEKLPSMDTRSSTPEKSQTRIVRDENTWQCDECLGTNERSIPRCGFCAKPRFAASSISINQIQQQDKITNDNQTVLSNKYSKKNEYKSLDPNTSGKFC
ncbi:unnamed protein product [Rotaria sp. Silwood1]|nr:unnamed protein product [Rotaria sp. Silwood1]CAF4939531.1 unnamed protein product [Rotaria sp. Silwood1]